MPVLFPLTSGMDGKIAVSMVFYGDDTVQVVGIPWMTIGSAAEADLALLFGIGFPPFRGGIFRWVDTVGMAYIAGFSEKFAHLGKSYELTDGMQAMLASGETYY